MGRVLQSLQAARQGRTTSGIPDGIWLSPGRHRRGSATCLMELTSVLAGEPKSDAPRCTDPVLAALARSVNDFASDENRQRLTRFVPDLIGACGADARVRRAVARRCLLTALPYARGTRRFLLSVALLGVDRADAGVRKGWKPQMFDADTEWALLEDGRTADAAARFVAPLQSAKGQHTERGLPAAVEAAVATISWSADDADDVLLRLLEDCVRDYRDELAREPVTAPASADARTEH